MGLRVTIRQNVKFNDGRAGPADVAATPAMIENPKASPAFRPRRPTRRFQATT
jgi:hypothetical protein